MNEEEKKAIDFLKETNFDYLDYDMCVSSVNTISNLVERLQKENEELQIVKFAIQTLQINSMEDEKYIVISKNSFLDGSYKNLLDEYIPVQKIREKIEEMQKEYNKLDEEVDRYINDVNKDLAKYYENKEKISIMQTLSCFIDTLQELLEGRK